MGGLHLALLHLSASSVLEEPCTAATIGPWGRTARDDLSYLPLAG